MMGRMRRREEEGLDMARDEERNVSRELDAMAGDVMGSFLDDLADGTDPGVALCCEDMFANRYEVVFTEDDPEACLEAAQAFVREHAAGIPAEHMGPIERYVIAYTGAVGFGDQFEDALLVSFFERGLDTGYSAYVLYKGFGTGDDFVWSTPEPAGEEPPLI